MYNHIRELNENEWKAHEINNETWKQKTLVAIEMNTCKTNWKHDVEVRINLPCDIWKATNELTDWWNNKCMRSTLKNIVIAPAAQCIGKLSVATRWLS